MGNGLPSPSPTCLPCPDADVRASLIQAGVVFILPASSDNKTEARPVTLEDRLKANSMYNCKLPASWGLLETDSRGDIQHGYVINSDGITAAKYSWMSKGDYDNECKLTRCDVKHIDKAHARLKDNGWYERVESAALQAFRQYVRSVNAYINMQVAGLPQENLDEVFQRLEKMFEACSPVPVAWIEASRNCGKPVRRIGNQPVSAAVFITPAKRFSDDFAVEGESMFID